MTGVLSEILIITALLLLNALFVMSEMAVVSSRKARLQRLGNDGDKAALRALQLARNPGTFLSTVQIGITLIGIIMGALGGAALSAPLASLFGRWALLRPYAVTLAFAVIVVSITALTLLVGELVPKRIALNRPERIAAVIAGPMTFLSRLFRPLVWLLDRSTDFALKTLHIKPSAEPPITEEEIQLLIHQGAEAGVIEEDEKDMVKGVFSLGDSRVSSLMTPRSEITWLDVLDPADEIGTKIGQSSYSRFPVCEGTLDNVLGILRARDLLVSPGFASPDFNLRDRLTPAVWIPDIMPASRALEEFKQQRAELMLVSDERGDIAGLITLDDIIEEIVGDIEVEKQAAQRQDGSWLLDGLLPVDDFKEIFRLDKLPGEEEYESLGGFVMMNLGRVPQAADYFAWNGLRFEVVDMDGRRVDKVLVTTLPVGSPAQPPGTAAK